MAFATESAKRSAKPSPPEKPHYTILLVEDEDGVRRLAARLLGANGFRVLATENGRTAEPVWREHKHEIDILLTDIVMPEGISGGRLAERFLKDKPTLKVILTSGYNVEVSENGEPSRKGINFMQKPYRPDLLLKTVRAALNGSTENPPE